MPVYIKGEHIRSLRRKRGPNGEISGPLDNHFGAHRREQTNGDDGPVGVLGVLRNERTGAKVIVPKVSVWETGKSK